MFGGLRSRKGESVLFGDIYKEPVNVLETEIFGVVFLAGSFTAWHM